MQEYTAHEIKKLLLDLPWLNRIGGIVQTLEEQRRISDTETQLLKYPVTRDINETLAPGAYAAMLPDSRFTGIAYFETGSFNLAPVAGGWRPFSGSLRLVVWCNPVAAEKTQADLQFDVLKALSTPPAACGMIVNMQVNPVKILDAEDKIFNRYSYDPKVSQLLLFPYYAFAIDLNLTGRIKYAL